MSRFTKENPPPGIKLRKLKRPMVRDGRKLTEVFDVVVTLPRDERGRYPKKWSRGHATLKEAIAVRSTLEADKIAGRIVRPGTTTLGGYLAEWITSVEPPRTKIRRSTWASYETHVRVHLTPRLGTIRLNRLTTADVRRAYGDVLESGLKPATVRRIHATLHRALADAVEDHLLPTNPASVPYRKLPQAERYDYRWWNVHELSAFLDHVRGDRLFAAFHVLAFTGLRRGELIALRWRDVDLDGGTVSVHRAIGSVHHALEVTDTKTAHGVRMIELDDDTVGVLRAYRAAQNRERMKAGPTWRDEEGLVFTEADGSIVHPDRLSKLFRQRARDAGLPAIRLHDLRHGWASIAGRQGVPLKVIQERLGHHDPGFTARVYQHVLPGQGRDGAEAFARAIRSASEEPEAAES